MWSAKRIAWMIALYFGGVLLALALVRCSGGSSGSSFMPSTTSSFPDSEIQMGPPMAAPTDAPTDTPDPTDTPSPTPSPSASPSAEPSSEPT